MTSATIPLIRLVSSENTWKNRFEDDLWLFYDPFYDKYYSYNVLLDDCNEFWNAKYKEWILSVLGNGFIGTNGELHLKYSTLVSKVSQFKRICVWGSRNYPNQDLNSFSELEVNELITDLFFNPVGKTRIVGVMSYNTLQQYISVLSKVSEAFSQGKVSDGLCDLSYLPSANRGGVHPLFKYLAKKASIDFHEWVTNGSLGTVPVHIAMALLGDSIEIIRSKKTKFATQIFRWFSHIDKLREGDVTLNYDRLLKIFCYINAYVDLKKTGRLSIGFAKDSGSHSKAEVASILIRKDDYIQARYYEGISHEKALLKLPSTTGFRSGATKAWKYDFQEYLLVHQFLENLYPLGDVPFINPQQVSDFARNELRISALVILLCLTGARSWSEITLMTYGDVEMEFGITRYSTPITKTNHGIKAPRKSTHLVYEAVSIIRDCFVEGLNQKAHDERPIFTAKTGTFIHFSDSCNPMESRPLMRLLATYYDNFISQHPEFKVEHEFVSAHQFRHTWAEFALRRFEGDVQEVIRRQFMHSFGSSFTNEYSFSKLEPETRDSIVRNYLKEILQKIGIDYLNNSIEDEFEREFQGKAVTLLNGSLTTRVLSLEDIDSWAEEESGNYLQIQAHEYGYCLLKKDLVEHAKCYDDEASTAIVGAARFTDCSGCINFAAHKENNFANIKRQAISHQSNIDRLKKQYPHFTDEQPLIKASSITIEQASKIIKMWAL